MRNLLVYLFLPLFACTEPVTLDLPIDVTISGSDVQFAWEHGPASHVSVRFVDPANDQAWTTWFLDAHYQNLITSPVSYGTGSDAFDGVDSLFADEPLVSGQEYFVEVSICDPVPPGSGGCVLAFGGEQSFVAP